MAGTISLRAARIDAGLSLKEVAEAVGVCDTTVSKWERGKTYPNGVQLVALCRLYGRSLDEIRLP